MTNEPIFEWNEETGTAKCTVSYKNKKIQGVAICHPDDKDMQSKLTGQEIAKRRAKIECYIHIKENEILPKIEILNHLIGTMTHSKNFNPKSYEIKRVRAELQNLKDDLTTINEELAEERVGLKLFLVQKDAFYKQIRTRRAKIDKNHN